MPPQFICAIGMVLGGLLAGAFLMLLAHRITRGREKGLLIAVGIGFVLLVAASQLPGGKYPPEDLAPAACVEYCGCKADDLVSEGGSTTGTPFGSDAHRVYRLKGSQPARYLRVLLYQPAYFTPWQVMAVYEDVKVAAGG